MRIIDIENWKRKRHYHFFKEMDYPHYNICANVDITKFINHIKANDINFFVAMIYTTSKAANGVEELRYRMKGENVVEYDVISPAFTIMSDDGVFSFCYADFFDDFSEFNKQARQNIETAKSAVDLEDNGEKDNVIFITSIPWVSFTSVSHPIHLKNVDSVPRIAWGKYFKDGDKVMLPLSIQVHHALVDGSHMGKYFMDIQKLLDNPEEYMKL